jgi:hypothetical protein
VFEANLDPHLNQQFRCGVACLRIPAMGGRGRRIMVPDQPKAGEKKWAWGMAQVVECLPHKL